MVNRILARWARETAEPYCGKLTRLNLQMPLSLKEALDAVAEEEGVSVPDLARRMLSDKVREMESDVLGRAAIEKYSATLETRRALDAKWRKIDEHSLRTSNVGRGRDRPAR